MSGVGFSSLLFWFKFGAISLGVPWAGFLRKSCLGNLSDSEVIAIGLSQRGVWAVWYCWWVRAGRNARAGCVQAPLRALYFIASCTAWSIQLCTAALYSSVSSSLRGQGYRCILCHIMFWRLWGYYSEGTAGQLLPYGHNSGASNQERKYSLVMHRVPVGEEQQHLQFSQELL